MRHRGNDKTTFDLVVSVPSTLLIVRQQSHADNELVWNFESGPAGGACRYALSETARPRVGCITVKLVSTNLVTKHRDTLSGEVLRE